MVVSGEVEYKLDNKINYQHGGTMLATDILYMYAPSIKNIKLVRKIKSEYIKAFQEAANRTASVDEEKRKEAEKKQEAVTEKEKDEAFVQMFDALGAYGMDEDIVYDSLLRIWTSGAIKVNGEETFTNYHYEQLSCDQVTHMTAVYIRNFLKSSFMT